MPFLPRICRKWFGEEMKLPFVETWWLGQADVRRRVLDQLHRYVLLSAFGRDPLAADPLLQPLARRPQAVDRDDRGAAA